MQVPSDLYWYTALVTRLKPLYRAAARVESAVLGDQIATTPITKPIYVSSLARSGTTLITEFLASHPDTTSLQYHDFPNVWTPYWHNHLRAQRNLQAGHKTARAHGDRIAVNEASPDAFEEPWWMAHFAHLHQPHRDNSVAPSQAQIFAQFYRRQVQKLLTIRRALRYLAKGNYLVTRWQVLANWFPDMRLVVPVRDPATHIASLMRQDDRFRTAARNNPRIDRQLIRSGHYEFGGSKRLINVGDSDMPAIELAFQRDQPVRAWALYWRSIYHHIYQQLTDDAMRQRTLLVSYEQLCERPQQQLQRLLRHCDLTGPPSQCEWAKRILPPTDYGHLFSVAERADIAAITSETRRNLQALYATPA